MRKLSFIFLMLVAFVFTVSAQRTFKHPGSILAASDLERIKTHVNAGDEPWASLWKEMQADNFAKPTYTPYARAEIGGSNGQRQRAAQDAYAAMLNAIEWHVTGNEAYAKCAANILSAWATTLETATAELYQYPSRSLILAAEMLRNTDGSFYQGWEAKNRDLFLSKVRTVLYPACRQFCTYTNSHPSWYTPAALAVIAAGVLLDDEKIYQEGYQLMLDESHWGTMFGGSIDPSGQMREMGRDNVHGGLTLGDIAQACLVCWNQGDDLFGAGDNRLLKGMEYWCRYNTGHTDAPFEPVDCSGLDNMSGIKFYYISTHNNGFRLRPDACCFEAVYHHYKEVKGMDDSLFPYLTMAAKLARPDTRNELLGYGTLFFTIDAAASPYFTEVPAKPVNLKAEDGFKKIRISWNHPVGEDARGFVVYRSEDGKNFSTLKTWDYYANNEYIDEQVEVGKTYCYKVRLLNKAGYSEFSEVVSATAQEGSDALPARWTFAPIGNTLGGSLFTVAQDSTFVVGGAGKDIGGTADSEGFVYLKMKSDATLTVRLSSTEEAFYKVGIQMRSTLAAGAQRVGITLGEKGFRILRTCTRSSSNGNTVWKEATNYGKAPMWMRIKRQGKLFTTYISRDNLTWHQVGESTVSMPSTYYVGMASCSGNASNVYQTVFDHVKVEGTVYEPSSRPAAPTSLAVSWPEANHVHLSWRSTADADSFYVYRSVDRESYECIAKTRATSFVDEISENGTYYYKVSGKNDRGEGVCSSVKTVTTYDSEKLVGTIIGSEGSYKNNSSRTITAALDGNLSTFFDAKNESGDWLGYDMGESNSARLLYVKYAPRVGYASRMVGGKFQVSNTEDFSSAITVATIASAPVENQLTLLRAPAGKFYRYMRYIGPDKGSCNVAEIEFYGVKKTVETGIENVSESSKSLVSGRIYNLQGQEVKTVGKGLYIINGKKVVVR